MNDFCDRHGCGKAAVLSTGFCSIRCFSLDRAEKQLRKAGYYVQLDTQPHCIILQIPKSQEIDVPEFTKSMAELGTELGCPIVVFPSDMKIHIAGGPYSGTVKLRDRRITASFQTNGELNHWLKSYDNKQTITHSPQTEQALEGDRPEGGGEEPATGGGQ